MEVAFALRDTWTLQNHIQWIKSIHVNQKTSGHFKPINSKRFLCPTWEHLFHFTKTGTVTIDRLAVGVPYEYYEANYVERIL
jgi:site-specific DNA-methyltransferase (adenine-specific)